MNTITFQISDSTLADLINVFAQGYSAKLIDGTSNPLTKAQTAKANLVNYIKSQIMAYRTQQSIAVAQASVVNDLSITIQ